MGFLTIMVSSLLAVGTSTTPDEPAAGRQVAQELTVELTDGEKKESTVRYWLFLPESYGKVRKRFPLMLFLHGAGERGEDLKKVKQWGPPKRVEKQKDFPFIVASPQCPRGRWWNTEEMLLLLDHLQSTLRVDVDRVYVTGLSMGGYGSWDLLARAPERFAAAVPICGGGDPTTAAKMKNVPVWAFHGGADGIVPAKKSQAMVDAIVEAGGKLAKLTIYPGVGHNSWGETYANEKVYRWLLSQQRKKPGKGDGSR